MAKKEALKMCCLFNNLRYDKEVILGPKRNKDKNSMLLCDSFINSFNHVSISGLAYKVGMFLVVNIDESEFEFGEVVNIYLKNNKIFLELLMYKEITFDKHFFACIVKRTNKSQILEPSSLPNYSNCFCVTTKNATYRILLLNINYELTFLL